MNDSESKEEQKTPTVTDFATANRLPVANTKKKGKISDEIEIPQLEVYHSIVSCPNKIIAIQSRLNIFFRLVNPLFCLQICLD